MNNQTKKALAQEIIILLSFLMLFVIAYLLLWGQKSYDLHQRKTLIAKSSIISATLDSVENLEESPLQRQFVQLSADKNLIGLPKDYYTFLQTLSDKSKAKDFYNVVRSNEKIKPFPQEFEDFSTMIEASLGDTITLNISSRLLREKAIIDENLNRISIRASAIHNAEFLQKIGFWGLIIIYPVRISFLLFMWAIRTLREAKQINKSRPL
jgi:hypothetical protein